MVRVSAVINTLNEEKNIKRAISSVKKLADEVVVVDMHSEDKTAEIAKANGAKVFNHKKTNYVEPARNYAISKAEGEWILILDADEELPEKVANKLKKTIAKTDADYFRLPRKNIVFGKYLKYSRWWPDYNIRFFRKGKVTWNELIHSVPMTVGKGIDLPPKEDYAIVHYHISSVSQYIERLNRYTSEHARLLSKSGYRFNWTDIIKKPASEFLSRYFFGRGYKDGLHGLAVSGLQAFSELVLYLKTWEMTKFEEKNIKVGEVIETMKDAEKELFYWQADTLIKQNSSLKQSSVQRLKRKFKLS